MEMIVTTAHNKRFYPNACHVCQAFGKNIKLKRCANCKMVAYCSREHQTKDWPLHRELCRAICELEKCGVTRELHRCTEGTKESRISARVRSTFFIEKLLGRRLLPYENDLFIDPRCCETCDETDSSKLNDCTSCPDAAFCTKHPKDSKHSIKCDTSRLSFQALNVSVTLNIGNVIVKENYGENPPKNMDEAISFFLPHCHGLDTVFTSTKIWSVFLSEPLSRPYTFLYSMEKLSWRKSDKITIHVVGSSEREMYNVHLWQYLFHHRVSLRELKIVFVGPNVVSLNHVNIELCEECTKNKRKINIQKVQKLYADFSGERFFRKPDYVIGFNLGIHAHYSDGTWAPTIKIIAKLACPFSMTSYNEKESKGDREAIDSILKKNIDPLWAGKNPFSGLKPCRTFDHTFLYENQYLTIYEKLA
ncbi:uncharacterized protein [Venturia canescens]|uniref:uncharacterized protein n=1 Tax=Venturia canescens TaxID=32260 RepID=UPI001C9C2C7E|nr:uncharacterized protein LOC122407887 [Venturia canescens]